MCIVWTVGNQRAPHWNPTYLWWVSHCLTSQRCEIMRYVRTTWEYYIPNIARRSRRHLTHTVSHSTELMTERSDGTLTIRSTFLGSSSSQFSSQHGEAEPGSSQRVSENAWGEGGEQSLGVENCHPSSALWSYIHKHRQRSIPVVSSDCSIQESELWNSIQRVSVW